MCKVKKLIIFYLEDFVVAENKSSENRLIIQCVKTDKGWRIDESEFSILAATSSKATLEAYRAAVNPSTADPNVSRVWWLAGVSIAAIVPAVCLLRRRRRED